MNPILDAPVVQEQRFEYAGFWIRVVAAIIDIIVWWMINAVAAFAAFGDAFAFGTSVRVSLTDPQGLISLVIGLAYFSLMESSSRQATLGKMAVGIKVGKETGERISALNAVGRYFSKFVSAIILFIGYIMVGLDQKKQGLHDKFAGTTVYYS